MSGMMGGPPPPPGAVALPRPPMPGAGAPPQPGMPPGQPPAPPGMQLNPAFAQWQQMNQQVQAVAQANQKLQQQFDAAVALIKKDGMHGFKLDIEADSTIAPDEAAEKANRVEFLQQMVPMLENVIPLAQGNPPLAKLAKELVLFAARGFRVARSLEESMEEAFDEISGMPPNPKFAPKQAAPGKQENPQIEMAKTQADIHDTNVKAQTDQMAIAQKAQQAAQDVQVRREQIMEENRRNNAEMSLRVGEMGQRERLEAAKTSAAQARSMSGLT